MARKHPRPPPLRKGWLNKLLIPYWWLCYDHRPDVVTHETREGEWEQLRSNWRLLHSIFAYLGPPCHILWNIKWPLFFNMIIAAGAFIDSVLWVSIVSSEALLNVTTQTWRLSSFMLALLLGFRVNRVYDRWWVGRQAYTRVGNVANTLAQQTVNYVADPLVRAELLRWCRVWQYTIYQLLTRGKTLHPDVAGLLDPEELAYYETAPKGRHLVVTRLRQLIAMACLEDGPFTAMDTTISNGVREGGTTAHIFTQCMPYALTLAASGFLEIWLLIMPFALYPNIYFRQTTGLVVVSRRRSPIFELLMYFLVCMLMLGVDEVCNQLEQPFPHMPLKGIVESTLRDINRAEEEAETMARLGARRLIPGDGGSSSAAGPQGTHNGGSSGDTGSAAALHLDVTRPVN